MNLRAFLASQRGSAVEFALVLPIMIVLLLAVVDFCNLFADRRQASRIAESIVRTAHALDQKIVNSDDLALSDDTIQLLSNIAARMNVQLPGARNYVWIGRYVRPHSDAFSAPQPVRQLLPNGLKGDEGEGLILNGKAERAARRNRISKAQLEPIALPGEIFYAVEIGFTRQLFSPVPSRAQRHTYKVRYIQ